MLNLNEGLVLGVAVNADTAGVTATGVMLILGNEDIAEVEASLGRLATEGLLVASDESPRWFVTDAGKKLRPIDRGKPWNANLRPVLPGPNSFAVAASWRPQLN